MNFKVGSIVNWKHINGCINFIDTKYLTICINASDESLPCCVLCYREDWKDLIVIN